jgi:hypothetical protein
MTVATEDIAGLPLETPPAVRRYAELGGRAPVDDPSLGRQVSAATRGTPPHRLVAIGDSLTHGVQSGAVFLTDLAYPAIIAGELGWDGYRHPQYPGRGGLPLNIELVLRELEHHYGSDINLWEAPLALFRIRNLMDDIEDYWERGAGSTPPAVKQYMHALAVLGWDLRDALDRTAANCYTTIGTATDSFTRQSVEHASERSALRVYPTQPADANKTLFDTAVALGEDHSDDTEAGIETLIIMLGSNNALRTVIDLRLNWTSEGFDDSARKGAYTMWNPAHFTAELAHVVDQVRPIKARHVIWTTVPHVTIAPIARGVGGKSRPGSRYFDHYSRPWISDDRFDPQLHSHLTGPEARAIDYGIDMFNEAITTVVDRGRAANQDWYVFDLSGLLDRLASRRYIRDPAARPAWWTPYALPPQLAALSPPPDSRFLTGDGSGGRAAGGLFSLDGIHPTTVAFGVMAQEIITIMRGAGVQFRRRDDTIRPDPITVDFGRLIQRDSLLTHPPQNVTSSMETLAWADTALNLFTKAFQV